MKTRGNWVRTLLKVKAKLIRLMWGQFPRKGPEGAHLDRSRATPGVVGSSLILGREQGALETRETLKETKGTPGETRPPPGAGATTLLWAI